MNSLLQLVNFENDVGAKAGGPDPREGIAHWRQLNKSFGKAKNEGEHTDG